MENHVVIMAGGVGSRFWPMSTMSCPKQFIDVLGCGKTLIQMTAERFKHICPIDNMWVVTSGAYVDAVKEQLPDLPECNILAEPAARNTAPCIAYACWKIKSVCPQANVIVTPADALVTDVEEYRCVIRRALDFTGNTGSIVTVGIKPVRPETGYGYICCDSAVDGGTVVKVKSFKEKPSLEVAERYLAEGGYLWNAGIFVWNVDTIMTAMRKYAPGISTLMDKIAESFGSSHEAAAINEFFPQCEKISIDYAVMEKSPDIYTVPGDFGWSDLGTWGSLWANASKDESGNAFINGNVSSYDSSGCVVHVSSLQKVVMQGLDGYIVAEKNGKLLICRLNEEQRIRDFVKE